LARAAVTVETKRIKGSILDVYDDDDDDDITFRNHCLKSSFFTTPPPKKDFEHAS